MRKTKLPSPSTDNNNNNNNKINENDLICCQSKQCFIDNLLIYGYCRQNTSSMIPYDVIKLCYLFHFHELEFNKWLNGCSSNDKLIQLQSIKCINNLLKSKLKSLKSKYVKGSYEYFNNKFNSKFQQQSLTQKGIIYHIYYIYQFVYNFA